jgi:LysR family hydrogen peroxide-inducible transcriptional activator
MTHETHGGASASEGAWDKRRPISRGKAMNIRDLEYIVALAEKKNFGLAARVCNVSQPALSSQVKKLEEYLGVKLFERTQNGVVPTDISGRIISNARIILDTVSEIKQYARSVSGDKRPKMITLGVIPTVAPYYLPCFFGKMAAFNNDKNVRWHVLEDKTQSLVDRLDSGDLDVAILALPLADAGHPQCVLFEEELYLAMASNHPLAAKAEVTIGDIGNETWILLDDGHCLNIPMMDLCRQANIGVDHHSFRAASLETVRHMVAQNCGITLIPEMARRYDDGIAYFSLKSPVLYKRAIGLIWRKNGLHADIIGELSDHL